MRCPECGGEYSDSFAFCPYCGKRAAGAGPGGVTQAKKPAAVERTVLIVDDDETIVKLLSTDLRFRGYKAIAALDGEQALMITHRMKPDVILMDIAMPGLNGIAVIDKIRQSKLIRHIPIIIVTAYDKAEYRQQAREAGVNDFILKPFSPEKIAEAIEGALRQ
jgi:CheY-like chemotaxis protein